MAQRTLSSMWTSQDSRPASPSNNHESDLDALSPLTSEPEEFEEPAEEPVERPADVEQLPPSKRACHGGRRYQVSAL